MPPSPDTAEPSSHSPQILRFAVVDVETTGLTAETDQILQLAVVALDLHPDGSSHHAEWSTLIRTRRPWDSVGPRHIHGIRRRSLWGAPPMTRVIPEFRHLISGRIFTAHNAAFDSGFLLAAAGRAGTSLALDPRLCTLELSRRLDPDKKLRHRLADLAARYGIDHDNPHDALEDARTTAAVLPHLLRAHGITDPAGLFPHFLPAIDRPSHTQP